VTLYLTTLKGETSDDETATPAAAPAAAPAPTPAPAEKKKK
jgi:hypothetical protein